MRSGLVCKAAIVCMLFLSPPHAKAAPLAAGHTAPPFVLKQADGSSVSLASHKGQVVLLNFWAIWCAPCRVEMPWFEEFSRIYAQKGLVLIGVSLDDGGWAVITPVVSKLKVSYPIVRGDEKTVNNYGMGDLLPATFLIDRTGKIRTAKVGFGDKTEFDKNIEQLLHEK